MGEGRKRRLITLDFNGQPAARRSRYFAFMCLSVSYIVSMTLSSETRGALVRRMAIRAALIPALTGNGVTLDTRHLPPDRQRVAGQPRLYSMPISAATQTCSGLAPTVQRKACRRHRTSDPDFTLTADFRAPGNRRVHLIQRANSACRGSGCKYLG